MKKTTLLPTLPIEEHLADIAAGIRSHTISVLQAPPGSGKTTILPIYLAGQEWLKGRKILILQPRRLAAKGVATRMSELLGEPVGATVGYQIRLERRKSATTRIEIITEGLLTRRILADPELQDVGVIIFDEFHERSLNADIGFILSQEIASVLRSDLRIVIMSATLDAICDDPNFYSGWRYTFTSKPFPVDLRYLPRDPRKPIWEETARAIQAALQQYQGDLLAFLPGAFEIERCREILLCSTHNYQVFPLYGELDYEQQQAALRPLADSERKVVLATNIAETSLTIEGVRIVVDSGLQKISRSPDTGITSLKTERITRDAADQRAGRAGRTASGVCLRLWSEQEHLALRPTREPEILRADLTQSILELAAWGVRSPESIKWITAPPAQSVRSATELLMQLGAINLDGTITKTGEDLVNLGTHPRIGACCITARAHGLESYAAAIIPLLEERTPTSKGARFADLSEQIEGLASGAYPLKALQRVKELQQLWIKRLGSLPGEKLPPNQRVCTADACGFLLAIAFPERIARRRPDNKERYLLASGTGAALQTGDPLSSSEYIVIAEMQERTEDARIVRAAPLNSRLFTTHLKHLTSSRIDTSFDPKLGVLVSNKLTTLGCIALQQDRDSEISPAELQSALEAYLRTPDGFARLPFSGRALALQERIAWVRRHHPNAEIPDISSEALRSSEPYWLSGKLPKSGRISEISPSTIEQALNNHVPWAVQRELDQIAPQTITLPNGKTKPVDYSSDNGPVVEAIIQEVFGLTETPRIGRYQTPVVLKLLSPARRPMQVTVDLAGFWRGSYQVIRKELRGRYPKHRWPEKPEQGDG
jgi:ATP-dependent helicase HrpB